MTTPRTVRALACAFALLLAASCAPTAEPGAPDASPSAPSSEAASTRTDSDDPVESPRRLDLDEGVLQYTLLTPPGHTPTEPRPVLLVLPPAAGSASDVDDVLDAYVREPAMSRGWVVVAPQAPRNPDTRMRTPFYLGSESAIPPLLDDVSEDLAIEGGAVHVAGVSTGGVGAFRVATLYPDRFLSVVVLPGQARDEDLARIGVLADTPVRMYAGEDEADADLAAMRETASALEDAGGEVELILLPGDGHVLTSLTGDQLFDWLDAQRP